MMKGELEDVYCYVYFSFCVALLLPPMAILAGLAVFLEAGNYRTYVALTLFALTIVAMMISVFGLLGVCCAFCPTYSKSRYLKTKNVPKRWHFDNIMEPTSHTDEEELTDVSEGNSNEGS